MGMLMYMGVDGSLYAFSLFLPSVINALGYTANKAQLLTVPPYAVACVMVKALFKGTYKRHVRLDLQLIGPVGEGYLILHSD